MFKAEITKTVELDNYENGCDPDTFQDHGVVDSIQGLSIKDVQFCINKQWDLSKFEQVEIDEEDTRLEFRCREDAEGNEATVSQIEAWKRGEIHLWDATYTIFFSQVTYLNINPTVLLSNQKAV